jgi:hypothetical protein
MGSTCVTDNDIFKIIIFFQWHLKNYPIIIGCSYERRQEKIHQVKHAEQAMRLFVIIVVIEKRSVSPYLTGPSRAAPRPSCYGWVVRPRGTGH